MLRSSLVAAAVAASLSLSAVSSQAFANHTVSGVVVDNLGKPVANAKITVHGSAVSVKTDKDGKFTITEAIQHVDEIHVAAAGYNHASLSLVEGQDSYTLTLSKSLIEHIDVTATPLHASTLESATPITVISNEDLNNKHSATLGETLKSELGVHSSYYGPISSTPIIRGLDGPRVMIAQNGLDVSDASRVGPDHVVSTETSTVEQIEVLRGPATLFFGSGAIGGVVNVVDNRVPRAKDDSGEIQISNSSVADEGEISTMLNQTFGDFVLHFDGFYRDGDDYEVPGKPELEIHDDHDEHDHEEHEGEEHHDEHEEHADKYTLENSASRARGFNIGGSLILDNGFIGASVGYMDRLYGIPGHDHGHGGEHGHDEEHDDHEEHEGEEGVKGDLKQTRVQVISELYFENTWFTNINTRLGVTNYEHQEIEGEEVGTRFENDSLELRTDLMFAEVDGWHGALTFDYKNSDFFAAGEEAFTPPSETTAIALGLIEEKHFGDVLLQAGARIERVEIESAEFDTLEFTPFSISAGLVYDFADGYNAAISLTHSSRAPSAAELLSFGPHIGTNSVEVGAIYELVHAHEEEEHEEEHEGDHLNEEHEEHHGVVEHLDEEFEVHAGDLKEETSNNIELSLRKFEGNTGFVINAFYNRVNDFYYQSNTGLFFADEHGHDEHDEHMGEEEHMEGEEHHDEHEAHDEHGEEGLPIYHFVARDAEFYGVEAQYIWQATDQFKVTFQADSITGKLTTGEYLPRIPPMRYGATFNYELQNTSFELSTMVHAKQDKVAEYETETDGYTMTDFYVNHYVPVGNADLNLFLKVNNVFDQEARVHSSFLKNDTLLPGRSFVLGVRGMF